MYKYLAIIKIAWQKQLTYRADFFGFRIGNILEILTQIIIWSVIFNKIDIVKGYTYNEMVTYIIMSWLFYFITTNYGIENVVKTHIHGGEMSNFLTKPIPYIHYITAYSIGRVSIALSTAIIMQIIFVDIFYKNFIFNFEFIPLIIILVMLFLGYFIRLYLSMLIGFVAFWTTEVVGINFAFTVTQKFLSGSYFPINLLPTALLTVSSFFPFVYLSFIPAQLYLKKITAADAWLGIGIEAVWLLILYLIVKIVWKAGVKKHEGVGI